MMKDDYRQTPPWPWWSFWMLLAYSAIVFAVVVACYSATKEDALGLVPPAALSIFTAFLAGMMVCSNIYERRKIDPADLGLNRDGTLKSDLACSIESKARGE